MFPKDFLSYSGMHGIYFLYEFVVIEYSEGWRKTFFDNLQSNFSSATLPKKVSPHPSSHNFFSLIAGHRSISKWNAWKSWNLMLISKPSWQRSVTHHRDSDLQRILLFEVAHVAYINSGFSGMLETVTIHIPYHCIVYCCSRQLKS